MKKIIFILLSQLFLIGTTFATGSLKSEIDPTEGTTALNPTTGTMDLASVFSWFKGELLTIIFIIAVCVFVFIGIRMAAARGNPEEFKKAWMHFVYAIIGIFIAFAAWGMVSLISNLGSHF